ncbi:plasmid mobilization protein [Mucilaginibacter ginsenosidivorax]|uniref:Plasmid mobilization relaxosome protein MobC n=1 Tax=Mucilaginibacter ginsenosidivorax TaxID=862126 RepID=A0A5B8W5I7_9SPHI|nr:plasmid mobilization relaxosome protein MobC [Mucilaginibacter ginsenosidivorax]QEC79340.1 plasmid mobilization relaxosome protein MobC [Mucilaginibacter ginsenosidivorax]
MPRPVKTDDDKRKLVIRLRVSSSEKSLIWQLAKSAGKTPSDFLRGLAIGAKPARSVPTLDREILLKILSELGKQGSNLNQIARELNRRQDHDEHDRDGWTGIDKKQFNHVLEHTDELRALIMEALAV